MGDAPAPIGPNDWVAERLADIDRMTDASKQVGALLELEAELLPSPSDVLQRVLTAADNLQDDAFKAETLSAIAPHLPESDPVLLERALAAVENLQDDSSKAYALIAITPRLPESNPALLERALTAVDNIRDDAFNFKARTLIAIAPRLPESETALLERALTAADNLWDDRYKAQALIAIAPRLPESGPEEPEVFQHRPFIWHIWDGLKDGFAALVNYHKLDYKGLETLAYTYLGDWIRDQQAAVKAGISGADNKLLKAQQLQKKLALILQGEAPYDIFVRWKPLDQQPIGWHPDLKDGVRLNIRPFVQAGVLRKTPNIKWNKDRGKNPPDSPWGEDRNNDIHLTLEQKRPAQEPPQP